MATKALPITADDLNDLSLAAVVVTAVSKALAAAIEFGNLTIGQVYAAAGGIICDTAKNLGLTPEGLTILAGKLSALNAGAFAIQGTESGRVHTGQPNVTEVEHAADESCCPADGETPPANTTPGDATTEAPVRAKDETPTRASITTRRRKAKKDKAKRGSRNALA